MAGEVTWHYLRWQALPQDRRHGGDPAIDLIRQTRNRRVVAEPRLGVPFTTESWATSAPWIVIRDRAVGRSVPPILMSLPPLNTLTNVDNAGAPSQWAGGASEVGQFYDIQLIDWAGVEGIDPYWSAADYRLYDFRLWYAGSGQTLDVLSNANPNFPDTENWPFLPTQAVLDFWADPWHTFFQRVRSASTYPVPPGFGVLPVSVLSPDDLDDTPPASLSRPEAIYDQFAADWFHDPFRWYGPGMAIWTGFDPGTGWQGYYWPDGPDGVELPVYQCSPTATVIRWDADLLDDAADGYILSLQDGTSQGPFTRLPDYPSTYASHMDAITHWWPEISFGASYEDYISAGKFCIWLAWPDVRGIHVEASGEHPGNTIYWRPLTRPPLMIASDNGIGVISEGPGALDTQWKSFLIGNHDFEDLASWNVLGTWGDSTPNALDQLVPITSQPAYGQLVMLRLESYDFYEIRMDILMNPHRWPNSVRAAEGLIPGFDHPDQRPP